jgi:hypothetical protein
MGRTSAVKPAPAWSPARSVQERGASSGCGQWASSTKTEACLFRLTWQHQDRRTCKLPGSPILEHGRIGNVTLPLSSFFLRRREAYSYSTRRKVSPPSQNPFSVLAGTSLRGGSKSVTCSNQQPIESSSRVRNTSLASLVEGLDQDQDLGSFYQRQERASLGRGERSGQIAKTALDGLVGGTCLGVSQ